MAGSDFLDTLSDAYQSEQRVDFRKVLVANVYVGLTSLLKGTKPNLSLLLDQLFSLKASAGVGTPTTKKEPTILSDLICSSDLLARLERYLIVHPQKRGQDLLSSLRSYRDESKAFHHRYQKQRKKTDKGKGRVPDLPAVGDMHVHRMSLVTQVQDLFPDLGSGYIVRLLDHYGDNPETVVAHLLDNSLPPEFQELDQSEQLPVSQTTTRHDPLPPHSTPPEIPSPPAPAPARKNIFDTDIDLAELARSADRATQGKGKLRFGRGDPAPTADTLLSDRTQHAANKAAIMSALAAFDSDDDEHDDTYDVADVGGTVDGLTAPTDAEADTDLRTRRAEDLDMTLFNAYKANPALFTRDSATRRSQPRASLKRETGMTDEAIEGWGVMLARDSKRLAKLEDRFAMAAGGPGGALAQPELLPTAYRKPGPREDGESSDTDQPSSGGGRGGAQRGRGRGGRRGSGGGRGRGGGPSGEQNPAVARQRKEENKASRANHNRRQQRARKIARGGGMPG
jgi:activating signal cointegrator complex subunit 2